MANEINSEIAKNVNDAKESRTAETKPVKTGYKGRGIVRIAATDIAGQIKAKNALRKIKGVGHPLAHYICISTQTDPEKRVGEMSEDDIKKIEEFLKDMKLPSHLLNRQRDLETGENKHLIGTGLDFRKREDIHFLRKIRAYRGIRHELGLPVRGQRTRSSFRKNKTVGVVKKKQAPAKAAAK
ncbi:MAG: 30S ribosomal protein S13 [Candidatus Aenigmarchaeota archaeon]|nr:30S ribosomal protein S13 [Candidatus Aenigmarchaeota archaeon]